MSSPVGLQILIIVSIFFSLITMGNSRAHTFFYNPIQPNIPQLILISGGTGTGKSTFGMSVALSQGILRCLSTDSIRQVLRTTHTKEAIPALFRSSYSGDGDPILQWKETCGVIDTALQSVIFDALDRGNSLVLEGVGIMPNNEIIERWTAQGGMAMGCVMSIRNAVDHQTLLYRRGEMSGKGEEKKLREFGRVRAIQDEMVRLGETHGWLIVEQRMSPSPIEEVGDFFRSQQSARKSHGTPPNGPVE